jgi:hypothetical protein
MKKASNPPPISAGFFLYQGKDSEGVSLFSGALVDMGSPIPF